MTNSAAAATSATPASYGETLGETGGVQLPAGVVDEEAWPFERAVADDAETHLTRAGGRRAAVAAADRSSRGQ
jgi:hypothetical protein